MPLPLLAGIPWLAGVIGAFFVAMFTWLVQFVTKKIALVLAVVSVIALVTTTFFAAIHSVIAALSFVSPPFLSTAVSWVVPDNFTACVSAILTAHLLKWAYAWQVRILQYKLF